MFGDIRTMTNAKGETFFVGKDVARALGYSKCQNAIATHVDEEDKSTAPIQGTAYQTRAIVINESGLYSLILSSKLPQAKVFKRWVTSEVLPQIRRTGGYIPTHDMEGRPLTDEEIVRRSNRIMCKTLQEVNNPNTHCLTATEVAKSWGMQVRDFNRMLCDMRVQHWSDGRYILNEGLQNLGFTEDRTFFSYSLHGEPKTKTYMVWTPLGVEFIIRAIQELR